MYMMPLGVKLLFTVYYNIRDNAFVEVQVLNYDSE